MTVTTEGTTTRHSYPDFGPSHREKSEVNSNTLDVLSDEISDLRERINSSNANTSRVLQAVTDLDHKVGELSNFIKAVIRRGVST